MSKNNKKKSKILTKRGYALIKEDFGFRVIHKCKKDLNVSPYINEDFGGKAIPFPVYLESSKKIYLPRHYGLEHFGEPDKVKIEESFNIDIDFKGSIRDNQKTPIEVFLKSCKPGSYSAQSNGGILALPCGYGKTVCALYILSKIKKKTIIIVHKEFLMEQWKERIKQFLPDARVGIIQQNKVKVKQKDIVLAMLQSISMKNYPPEIFNDFGFCIVDECHHISSQVFSRCLPKLGCKYNLGLSATPKRKDGLSKVFHWYLGPTLFQIKKRDKMDVDVECIYFDSNEPVYTKEELTNYGKISMPKMINNICEYKKRTMFIIELIKICSKENRKTLFLSDRRAHLDDIYQEVLNNEICSVGYYVGGMKQEERKKSEKMTLMLGTYTMAAEGLDVKELNTIIFGSPKSDITQSVGRILRQKHAHLTPKVFDIVDNSLHVFNRQALKRIRFYKSNDYCIHKISIYDKYNDDMDNLMEQYYDPKNKEKIEKRKSRVKKNKKLTNGICLI